MAATSNLFYAFAPDGTEVVPTISSEYEGPVIVDDYRPVQVTVPQGATFVTISASGNWGFAVGGPSGPGGVSITSGPTIAAYMTLTFHSENITSCTCNLGSLAGLWNKEPERIKGSGVFVLDRTGGKW